MSQGRQRGSHSHTAAFTTQQHSTKANKWQDSPQSCAVEPQSSPDAFAPSPSLGLERQQQRKEKTRQKAAVAAAL